MAATALAYVQHAGNAAAMAVALHLHPQTVRYRITRLRELLGDARKFHHALGLQVDFPRCIFRLPMCPLAPRRCAGGANSAGSTVLGAKPFVPKGAANGAGRPQAADWKLRKSPATMAGVR